MPHPPSPPPTARQTTLIAVLVFTSGLTSVGTEISATNLIAPYFGESTFIWATIIGLTLGFLALGYSLGGRLADLYPTPRALSITTAGAAIATGLLPLVSRPILATSIDAFATRNVGAFYGALIATLLLLAIPITLLGFVTPFAVRLVIDSVDDAGRAAGRIYALSTLGSIAGSFLPVLVLVPTVGTARTFLVLSLILLVPSLIGLLRDRAIRTATTAVIVAIVMAGGNLWAASLPIRPPELGETIFETESSDNYIQVTQRGSTRYLILNDGHAFHSVYDPDQLLTHGPWDYFMIGPLFVEQTTRPSIDNVLIVGLAGGTSARQITAGYGTDVTIDGIEIDPTIAQVGRDYFGMDLPNLTVIIQDGRYVLRTTDQRYDLIAVDAYRQPYIPFQLTTQEFFQEVDAALTDTGTAVMNVGRTATDYRLVDAIASTMKSVFPHVFIIDTDGSDNSMVIGTHAPASLDAFAHNATTFPISSPIRTVADWSRTSGNMREVTESTVVFTDDHAPVNRVIDVMILDAAKDNVD